MANRVLIGNRATGGYGLYVSRAGDNVLSDDGLLFDSRTGTGWSIATYGEDSFDTWNEADHTITHNLGYNPLVAIRWSHTITDGKSTEVYSPCWQEHYVDSWPAPKFYRGGLRWYHSSVNAIVVQNQAMSYSQGLIYYGYVIFREADFTGGRGI
jgi:hypothetical protein